MKTMVSRLALLLLIVPACTLDVLEQPLGPGPDEPVCGDGVVDPGEVCDDGNTASGDGCSATCVSIEDCGNGYLDVGEACDTQGIPSPACDADCTPAQCGDGLVNPAAGEPCDDGNTVGGDGCSADCRSDEVCGNFILDAGEQCDDGNQVSGDGCNEDCTLASCGDGIVDPVASEVCDGGGVDTATCDTDCTPPACGDCHTNTAAGEVCDDCNGNDTDACPNDCRP